MRAFVEPDDVAAFEPTGGLNRTENRVTDAHNAVSCAAGSPRRGRFPMPQRIAPRSQTTAVPDVDRIQADAVRPREHVHVRAARQERAGELLVLVDRALEIRRLGEAQRAPFVRRWPPG